MIRRIATLAALLLLTMMSAAMAHEHGAMPMAASSVSTTRPHIATPAVEVVMTAAPIGACVGDACDTAHQTADTCSAICAIACLAVLDDHVGVSPALVGRMPGTVGLAHILTPTADAPPTPPPRA